jgi:hypothetical protein
MFSIKPPGLPHAVFSVAKQGQKPTCVVMSGSHFISEYSLPLMLEAAISHSAWHDVWTNATHDDVIFHIDWMLHNILLCSMNGVPSPHSSRQQRICPCDVCTLRSVAEQSSTSEAHWRPHLVEGVQPLG